MLSVRNVILIALAVLILSLLINIVSLMGPPDSGGAAADSYGTHGDGYRAVFELLSAFHVPVSRQIEPPSATMPTTATLVLWDPHSDLVANEPSYLEQLIPIPWVERGGRLIVATDPPDRLSAADFLQSAMANGSGDIFSVLKLPRVRITSQPQSDSKDQSGAPIKLHSRFNSSDERREEILRKLGKTLSLKSVEFTTVTVTASGSFAASFDRIRSLQIPMEQVGRLEIDFADETSGKIDCQPSEGKAWTVAAAFPRGQGEIVVVAEPMLFFNSSIAKADNAAFAFDLLAPGGRSVVFDEFYHGLNIRGNPIWLLTKSTYLSVLIAVIVALGLSLWRRAILIGPPLEPQIPTRRTILEYIEAMARFLNRGRGSRPFLLNEIRAGTMRVIGERLGLPRAIDDPELIAAKMAKRSPRDAEQFQNAVRLLDKSLAIGNSLSETAAVRSLQGVSRCL